MVRSVVVVVVVVVVDMAMMGMVVPGMARRGRPVGLSGTCHKVEARQEVKVELEVAAVQGQLEQEQEQVDEQVVVAGRQRSALDHGQC
jgi:hypothetical protein